ncbi:TPR-like protein, partial [Mycena vitilis]
MLVDQPYAQNLYPEFGRIYWSAGRYEDAKRLQITVMEKRKMLLGDGHKGTLDAMHDLVVTYRSLHLHKQELLGQDHPEVLQAMGNLADTYWILGQYKHAAELQSTLLAKRKDILGDDHLDTLHAMQLLARTYRILSEYKQAHRLQVVV